jgi:hypothetical protein
LTKEVRKDFWRTLYILIRIISPNFAGSRAGLNIALTWATLMHFGRDEYVRRAQLIVSAAATLAVAIIKVEIGNYRTFMFVSNLRTHKIQIPGLFVVGSPEVSVVRQ